MFSHFYFAPKFYDNWLFSNRLVAHLTQPHLNRLHQSLIHQWVSYDMPKYLQCNWLIKQLYTNCLAQTEKWPKSVTMMNLVAHLVLRRQMCSSGVRWRSNWKWRKSEYWSSYFYSAKYTTSKPVLQSQNCVFAQIVMGPRVSFTNSFVLLV